MGNRGNFPGVALSPILPSPKQGGKNNRFLSPSMPAVFVGQAAGFHG